MHQRTVYYLYHSVVVELHFVPLEHWAAVDKYRPLPLRGHEEIAAIAQPYGRLSPGHLRRGPFQAQVHIDGVVASAAAHRDLLAGAGDS